MDSLLYQKMDSVSINIKPVFRKYALGQVHPIQRTANFH